MKSGSNIDEKLALLKYKACIPASPVLNSEQIKAFMAQLDGWLQHDLVITKTFEFKNYYHTISFVNAVAWVCNQQDHHPELGVSYNKCKVEFTTHDVKGLSENDFICAAKLDALLTA